MWNAICSRPGCAYCQTVQSKPHSFLAHDSTQLNAFRVLVQDVYNRAYLFLTSTFNLTTISEPSVKDAIKEICSLAEKEKKFLAVTDKTSREYIHGFVDYAGLSTPWTLAKIQDAKKTINTASFQYVQIVIDLIDFFSILSRYIMLIAVREQRNDNSWKEVPILDLAKRNQAVENIKLAIETRGSYGPDTSYMQCFVNFLLCWSANINSFLGTPSAWLNPKIASSDADERPRSYSDGANSEARASLKKPIHYASQDFSPSNVANIEAARLMSARTTKPVRAMQSQIKTQMAVFFSQQPLIYSDPQIDHYFNKYRECVRMLLEGDFDEEKFESEKKTLHMLTVIDAGATNLSKIRAKYYTILLSSISAICYANNYIHGFEESLAKEIASIKNDEWQYPAKVALLQKRIAESPVDEDKLLYLSNNSKAYTFDQGRAYAGIRRLQFTLNNQLAKNFIDLETRKSQLEELERAINIFMMLHVNLEFAKHVKEDIAREQSRFFKDKKRLADLNAIFLNYQHKYGELKQEYDKLSKNLLEAYNVRAQQDLFGFDDRKKAVFVEELFNSNFVNRFRTLWWDDIKKSQKTINNLKRKITESKSKFSQVEPVTTSASALEEQALMQKFQEAEWRRQAANLDIAAHHPATPKNERLLASVYMSEAICVARSEYTQSLAELIASIVEYMQTIKELLADNTLFAADEFIKSIEAQLRLLAGNEEAYSVQVKRWQSVDSGKYSLGSTPPYS